MRVPKPGEHPASTHAPMTTLEDRIHQLEERIRELEGDAKRHERWRRLQAIHDEGVAPAIAEMLLTLYEARGRQLTTAYLHEVVPRPRGGKGDIIKWYTHLSRQAFGQAVICSHPGAYSMDDGGRRLLEDAWAA